MTLKMIMLSKRNQTLSRKRKLIFSDKGKSVVALDRGREAHKRAWVMETRVGDGNKLYLDCGYGFTGVYNDRNSTCTLYVGIVYCT